MSWKQVIAVFNDEIDSVGQITVVAQSPSMDGEVATNVDGQDNSENEMSVSQGEFEDQTDASRSSSILSAKTKSPKASVKLTKVKKKNNHTKSEKKNMDDVKCVQ